MRRFALPWDVLSDDAPHEEISLGMLDRRVLPQDVYSCGAAYSFLIIWRSQKPVKQAALQSSSFAIPPWHYAVHYKHPRAATITARNAIWCASLNFLDRDTKSRNSD